MLIDLFGVPGTIILVMLIIIGVTIFFVHRAKTTPSKVQKNITKEEQADNGFIAELQGVHWYGLPANEGAKLLIDLYNDKLVFRTRNSNILTIEKQSIIAITSRSEKEIISSITKGTTKGGLGAAAVGGVLLGPAGMLTGAMVGKKKHQSETRTKTKKHLYFVLKNNTQYGEIALMVKSKGKLRRFVDMCNSALLR